MEASPLESASHTHRDAPWLRNPWVVGLAGLILSVLFTQQHNARSMTLFDWRFFLDFVGQQPFQSRVLPFALASGISSVHRLNSTGIDRLFQFTDVLSTFTAFFLVWKLACRLFDDTRVIALSMALFWWQMWVTFVFSWVHNYYYPYDPISIAFIASALWGIVTGWAFRWLLLLTVLAMFNRETSVIIAFFYAAWHWPASRQTWRNTLVLIGACIAVKLTISQALGAYGEMVSLYHVPGFLRLYYNFSFLSLQPRFLHTLNVLFVFGGAWALLPWRTADARLKRMLWCLAPYALGMSVVGNLSELRIFGEFIPLMALLVASKFVAPARPAPGGQPGSPATA
ncbi:MAG TPA: hypothetical protein H9903_01470 [Candidatus Aquabacterium excrementipullorum]|nr:hypothetical protein [Candidatus Aquabacterium excrementipullorum]